MGQAALFSPPPIHQSNVVLFPRYLQRKRLKQFVKSIQGQFLDNQEGLVTVVNDTMEFHYKVYNRHIELVEISTDPGAALDAARCLDFLKYEAYLLQKPIFCDNVEGTMADFAKEQGFRLIQDEEERQDIYQGFWEQEAQ